MSVPIHIMIDLETWGTKPGCDLRSIGACMFDPETGSVEGHFFHIAVDNPKGRWRNAIFEPELATSDKDRMYPLFRDPDTVARWNDQSDEAKGAFTDPADLYYGLSAFAEWLCGVAGVDYEADNTKFERPSNIRLWAHGPSFDVSILEAAYGAVDLPLPWHYRAPRDTRTILEAARMDPHKGLEEFSTGTYHNALDDAVTQAKAVCAAYDRLGLGPTRDRRTTELLAANNVAVEKRREACGLLREALPILDTIASGCGEDVDLLRTNITTFLTEIHK